MVGLGVYDSLAREMTDSDTGEVYPALSCCNDKIMAERCSDPRAKKVIWSIKASAQMNSDCAVLLREGFRSGKIRLLTSEYDADELLSGVKGYSSLSPSEKMKLQLPYIHTTLLIDELVKLQHDESGGKIRIFERAGMRKDRYSSLSYNYYVAVQLENKFTKMQSKEQSITDSFVIRAPNNSGKAVNREAYGNRHSPRWW